jgi:hypothetical protein
MITVRLPATVKVALERAAVADMRSLASLTAKVLTDYVRRQGFLITNKPTEPRRRRKGN